MIDRYILLNFTIQASNLYFRMFQTLLALSNRKICWNYRWIKTLFVKSYFQEVFQEIIKQKIDYPLRLLRKTFYKD